MFKNYKILFLFLALYFKAYGAYHDSTVNEDEYYFYSTSDYHPWETVTTDTTSHIFTELSTQTIGYDTTSGRDAESTMPEKVVTIEIDTITPEPISLEPAMTIITDLTAPETSPKYTDSASTWPATTEGTPDTTSGPTTEDYSTYSMSFNCLKSIVKRFLLSVGQSK